MEVLRLDKGPGSLFSGIQRGAGVGHLVDGALTVGDVESAHQVGVAHSLGEDSPWEEETEEEQRW